MRWSVALLPFILLACNPFLVEDKLLKPGIESYEQSQWADAEQAFDRAVEEDPSSEAHFNRGMSLYRQGRYEDAGNDLRRTLTSANDPLKARAWFDVGNSAAKRGKLDEAVHAYRRSLQMDPTDPDVLYNLEWALQQLEKKNDDHQSGDDDKQEDGGDDEDKSNGDGKEDEGGGEAKNDSSTDGGQGDDGEDGESQPDNEGDDGEKQADNQKRPGEEDGDEGQEKNDPSARDEGEQPDDGGEGQQAAGGGGEGEEEKAASLKPLDAQEMTEILDALDASEKNLQMWKFQEQRGDTRRKPGEKDW